jgi:DNA segregation ATPase FtsK/SpoIIIE, S-DNA-T family
MLRKNQYKNNEYRVINSKLKRRLMEGLVIIIIAFSLFLLLSLLTYHISDPSWSNLVKYKKIFNFGGYVGAWLADIFLCGFGYAAYLFPFILVYAICLPYKVKEDLIIRVASFVLILLSLCSLMQLNFAKTTASELSAGGVVGNLFGNVLLNFFNRWGANLLLGALFLSSITLLSGISWIKIAEKMGYISVKTVDFIGKLILCIPWERLFKKNEKRSILHSDLMADLTAHKEQKEYKVPIISQPQSIKTSLRAEQEKQITLFEPELEGSLPPLSLLDLPDRPVEQHYSDEQLSEISQNVELRLNDFGIDAKVTAVYPGPVVTRFELQLAAGTKVGKITSLVKDLARSLSVISVRIVEVIPGKSVIGLELPNEKRETVRLREILSSERYEATRAPLTIALGKDISGHPVIVDLAKMPHLLVAGTTGSGKSVCLNAMLLSLLYKYTAKEVRLILIDPKMLELSIYDGIPHLLVPVVTDMKKATNALRWCVVEMERRYKLLAALGVRNINGFNHKVKEAKANDKPLLDPLWQPSENGALETPPELSELPYIVVIADEYADMFMVIGKKIEELIARIAQKARAAGIHLVLATQRPSVDVITGLIKANISTRIALQVSSKIDSRTILDQSGAEQLLGFGDMLYLPPGSGVPIRIHGAFVADEEVHRVAKDLQRRAQPEYITEILETSADDSNNIFGLDTAIGGDNVFDSVDFEKDSLYDQAVQIVVETRRASISQIQRRLRIGYNRAARMVEAMEKAGLVGPMEVNGNREVLIPETMATAED